MVEVQLTRARAHDDDLKEQGYDTNNDTNAATQPPANPQVIEINGRPVGTRTPDLYRVKVAL